MTDSQHIDEQRSWTGLRILAAWFVGRFCWDVYLISSSWPDFSKPKMGMLVLLLPLAFGLWQRRQWAVLLAGMVCIFWLGWAIAMAIAPLVPGALARDYPWSNLAALPGFLCVLHYLQPDQAATEPGSGQS